MDKFIENGFVVVIVIAIVAAISALLAWLGLLLYNGCVVPVFHTPVLSFWQAWGIFLLINLLFGTIKTGGGK